MPHALDWSSLALSDQSRRPRQASQVRDPVAVHVRHHLLRVRALLGGLVLPWVLMVPLGACAGEKAGGPAPAVVTAEAVDDDPNPAGAYLAGYFALETGDLDAAARNLTTALAADPDNVELRRQIFLLRLAAGDDAAAVQGARALTRIAGRADEAELVLGLDRARAADWAAARKRFAQVGRQGVVALPLPVLVAWATFAAGDKDAAIAGLATPDDSEGIAVLKTYHRAVMLGLVGRQREAIDILRGQAGDRSSAPLRVVQTLAQLYVDTGDPRAAAGLVDDALAGNPDDAQLDWLKGAIARGERRLSPIRGPKAGMADALIGVAEALNDQQAGAQALLLARAAALVDPDLPDTRLILGRILIGQGNPSEAIRVLGAVPPGQPQSWSAQLLLAAALVDADRHQDAVTLLKGMAEARPQRTDALVSLADLYRRDERFAPAEAAYAKALALRPVPTHDDWRLYYALGTVQERLQHWPDAEKSLLQALKLQPDQPMVLNYLGYSWVDRGRNLGQAKAMLRKAVELRPDDGYIVDSLGWAYFRLGDYRPAVTELERAAELQPGDPTVNDHLGDAYWRAGRRREARFQWERALVFKPEPPLVQAIREKLEHGLPGDAANRG